MITAAAQDTIRFARTLKIGFDLFGPAYYLADKNNLSLEGFISLDVDTNRAAVIEAGYLDYKYSQYNYDYLSTGYFIRAGFDFNFIKPEVSKGKYYGGIGLRYGLSLFRSEVPYTKFDNYWGTAESSVPPDNYSAHFIEASPGIRTELFSNFIIGWTIRLRFLIYSSTGKDLKAIYIPGYGNGTRGFSPGINYYIVWNFPLAKAK